MGITRPRPDGGVKSLDLKVQRHASEMMQIFYGHAFTS